MKDALILKNRLKEARTEKKLSQSALAQLVGVSSVPLKPGSLTPPRNWR